MLLKTVFWTVFVDRLWQHNPCNRCWPSFYHYLRISWNPNHSPGIACSWKIGQHRFKKDKQTPTQKTSRYGLPRNPMSFPGKSKYVHQFMLLRFNLGGGNNSSSAFGTREVCCVYCLFHVRDVLHCWIWRFYPVWKTQIHFYRICSAWPVLFIGFDWFCCRLLGKKQRVRKALL